MTALLKGHVFEAACFALDASMADMYSTIANRTGSTTRGFSKSRSMYFRASCSGIPPVSRTVRLGALG